MKSNPPLFFFILLIHLSAHSWVNPENTSSSLIKIEQELFESTLNKKNITAKGYLSDNKVRNILKDYKSLIPKNFKITPYYRERVHFWFKIYTQFDSDQVVIHDKENFDLIYNVIDFKRLKSGKKSNPFIKSKTQTKLSEDYTRHLKKSLNLFAYKTKKLSKEDKSLLKKIKALFKIPKNKKKRKKFFRKLAKNIRTQTGQRDMIQKGIVRSIPYFPYLEKKMSYFKLPKELLAIPFLESSFNPLAYSKVSAAGAWQFMPFIASLFMPKRIPYKDYRLNIFVSSISAFHLLRENKQILKRWDLAVTAYNSGTKHLLKARKKLRKRKVAFTLRNVLDSYDNRHIGFASKNFYSEFIALVYVLDYKNEIYSIENYKKEQRRFKTKSINFYITKCTINPQTIINKLKRSSPNFKFLNSQFRRKNRSYKRGEILVSDVKLTSKRYTKVSDRVLIKYKPKFWEKYSRVGKCNR